MQENVVCHSGLGSLFTRSSFSNSVRVLWKSHPNYFSCTASTPRSELWNADICSNTTQIGAICGSFNVNFFTLGIFNIRYVLFHWHASYTWDKTSLFIKQVLFVSFYFLYIFYKNGMHWQITPIGAGNEILEMTSKEESSTILRTVLCFKFQCAIWISYGSMLYLLFFKVCDLLGWA